MLLAWSCSGTRLAKQRNASNDSRRYEFCVVCAAWSFQPLKLCCVSSSVHFVHMLFQVCTSKGRNAAILLDVVGPLYHAEKLIVDGNEMESMDFQEDRTVFVSCSEGASPPQGVSIDATILLSSGSGSLKFEQEDRLLQQVIQLLMIVSKDTWPWRKLSSVQCHCRRIYLASRH